MKKLLFVALVAIAFISCGKDEVKGFKLDPNAMVSIKPTAGAWNAPMKVISTTVHLSALDIVKQANGMTFQNIPMFGNQSVDVGFGSSQRDTISNPPALKFWATQIIDQFGVLDTTFITSTDCVLCRPLLGKRDTVGYVPNSVLRSAEKQIKLAYKTFDNEAVYRLFNDAFTFVPITGTEWRELKRINQQ